MNKKYLYLLGAGASARSLPVIAQINQDATHVSKLSGQQLDMVVSIGDVIQILENIGTITSSKAIIDCVKNLEKLRLSFEVHPGFTIDNICRYYFITNTEFYFSLKKASNQYFNFLESIKRIDHRYDLFLMNLLSNSGNFPSNIHLLSWNYDRQIQRSYLKLETEKKPIFSTDFKDLAFPGFREIKLNGNFQPLEIPSFDHSLRVQSFIDSFKNNSLSVKRLENLLKLDKTDIKFYWDSDFQLKPFNGVLRSYAELIVVGYSFPFYNREIDNYILRQHALNPEKKIVIQDLNSDGIIQKIESIIGKSKVEFVVLQPNEFYIPENLEYTN